MTNTYNHIDIEAERTMILEAQLTSKGFRPLYEKYYEEIFRFIYRRVANENIAEELCSETFYKALLNIKKFNWQGVPFNHWLYRIAGNEIKKRGRKKKEVFIIEIDKIEDKEEFREIPAVRNPEALVWAFDQLNEDDLRLIELRYFEEMPFDQISLLLDKKQSAVKMKLYRLLDKIKSLMEEKYGKI